MNKKIANKLKGIYDSIPNIQCKGLCHDSCTIIGFSKGEEEQLIKKTGLPPTVNLDGDCGYLKDRRCSAYDSRPAVCRLYGVAEGLECRHGCEPKRMLSRREADIVFSAVERLTGDGQLRFSAPPVSVTGKPDKSEIAIKNAIDKSISERRQHDVKQG